nr:hypothetical protein [Tanacetum cinerariifolium]
MVNTRTDADLSAAVQNALQTLLPQIRTEIRKEFRTSFGPSDAGGNPPPFFPRAESERLKREYHSIRQTSSSGLRRFFRYAMFINSFYLCYVLSLHPFTERYAQPYFFSCLIRQTDDELTEKELKQIEADDQAIQTILLCLPKDIYAAIDSCETAQEICALPRSTIIQSELHATTMLNPKDITDPTIAINMALALMAKAFKLNYSTQTNNNQGISSNARNRQIAQQGMNMDQDRQIVQNVGNQNGLIVVLGIANLNPNGNGNLVAARTQGNATGHNGIQLQAKEFDLMATAINLDEIEEVNANYILMANLQQASTSGTHTDKAPVYDSDGSAEFLGTVRFGNDHIAAILENYIPWSSHLLRYAKSRPNGKLIHNSILNGPYVRKMIPEPGETNRDINITETSHLQTDDELSDKELKQIEAD